MCNKLYIFIENSNTIRATRQLQMESEPEATQKLYPVDSKSAPVPVHKPAEPRETENPDETHVDTLLSSSFHVLSFSSFSISLCLSSAEGSYRCGASEYLPNQDVLIKQTRRIHSYCFVYEFVYVCMDLCVCVCVSYGQADCAAIPCSTSSLTAWICILIPASNHPAGAWMRDGGRNEWASCLSASCNRLLSASVTLTDGEMLTFCSFLYSLSLFFTLITYDGIRWLRCEVKLRFVDHCCPLVVGKVNCKS